MLSKKVIQKDLKFESWRIKWLRRLKIVVGVVSFACFVIQAEDLTKQYLNYSTVVTTELVRIKRIELPAVTVCKPVVFGYRMFCQHNESDADCVDRWVREAGLERIEPGSELNVEQQGLVLTDQEDKLLSGKPLLQLFGNMSLSKNFHGTQCWFGRPVKAGEKYGDSMEKCAFNQSTEKIIWSIISNNLCFTVFSQLAADYEKILVDESFLNSVAYSTIAFNYSELFPLNFLPTGYNIAVHPANLIPSQDFWRFHRILPNKMYEIEYGMTRSHLLPAPYQTNCRHYQLPGPLSHYDCLARCVFNNSWDPQRQCFGQHFITILNHLQPTDRLCEGNDRRYLDNKRKCEKACPKGCYKEHFWSVKELIDDDFRFIGNVSSNETDIRFQYSTRSGLIIHHHPEFTFASFIASIGGVAGVYLGISILSMYEMICALLEKVWRVKEKVKNLSIF